MSVHSAPLGPDAPVALRPVRQRLLLALAVLVGLAGVLRLALIPRSNLWADEVFSVATATGHSLEHPAKNADRTRGDFVEAAAPETADELRRYLEHEPQFSTLTGVVRAVILSDTSPPLYYLLLHGWTRLTGTSDFAVRAYSVAWTLACFPLLIAIARWTGGGRTVFGACAFFAFAPISVYYSIEARMYSQLWFCIAALMASTLLLHRRGGTVLRYSAWVAFVAAGLLTHYFFVFPLMAAVGFLVLKPGKLHRGWLAFAVVLAALLVAPWYVRMPEQLANWRVTKDWLEIEPRGYDRVAAITEFALHFFSGESYHLWKLHKKSNAIVFALFGLILLVGGLCLRRRLIEPPRLLLWSWFGAGCIGPIALDLVQGTYMSAVPRYASTALPAAYLLIATGLGCFGMRARLAVLALILAAWVPTLTSLFRKPGRSGPDLEGIARTISAESTASDLVLVQSIPSGVLGFARYFDGPAPIASWVEQLGGRRLPESLETLAAGRTRIHYFRFHEVGAAAPAEAWLRSQAVIANETQVGGTQIIEFRPKNRPTF